MESVRCSPERGLERWEPASDFRQRCKPDGKYYIWSQESALLGLDYATSCPPHLPQSLSLKPAPNSPPSCHQMAPGPSHSPRPPCTRCEELIPPLRSGEEVRAKNLRGLTQRLSVLGIMAPWRGGRGLVEEWKWRDAWNLEGRNQREQMENRTTIFIFERGG